MSETRKLAEQEQFARRWYEQFKADDPHHCAEHEEQDSGCEFPTTYGEYTFEIFRESPIVEAGITALASEWIKITDDPATLPAKYSSWLLAHRDTRDGVPTVDEAQWEGEKWRLARTGPYDDPIYIKEQAYAYMAIPAPPEV